jgi:uncharacterized membrane protein
MGSDQYDDRLDRLAARVEVLERDVGVMRGILWQSGAAVQEQPPAGTGAAAKAVSGRRPTWAASPTLPQGPTREPRDEARLVGTWFARGGALAVLIGAGFAFKYGIDRRFITEQLRVLIGLLAGLGFVAWGYWARQKGWHTFCQAVTAGGIAICYLSVIVANLAYHLISAPVTFAALVAVTVGSATLAYLYDSLALAILATAGGFLNPFLASKGGRPQGIPLYTYLAVLDAGVLGLAFFKAWRPLDALARVGTWLLFGVGLSTVGFGAAEAFATAFLLLFIVVPMLATLAPARRDERPSDEADGVMLAINAAAYFAYSMFLLGRSGHADFRGIFTFVLAAAFAALAGLASAVAPRDLPLRRFLWLLCVAATTVAIPLQFHRFPRALAWASEGVAVTLAGMRARSVSVRTLGAAILGGGAVTALSLVFARNHPAQLGVSPASGAVLCVVGALAVEAFLFSRDADPDSRRLWFPWFAIAANGLALAWMSAQAIDHYHAVAGGVGWQPLQFSLSIIWGLYAGILLTVGVATRQRWARLAALGLFAVTVAKMLAIDLWTLSTGERVLAFIGVGCLLLACSLMYHHFKDMILGAVR